MTRRFDVTPFSTLDVSRAFTVHVAVGSPQALSVRIDDNLVDELDVGVSGGTLRIGLASGADVIDATLEADVTVAPGALRRIEASGSSEVTAGDILTSDVLALSITGASRLSGHVRTRAGSVELSGASHVTLSGEATSLDVSESGASQLAATGLVVGDLSIDVSGASTADVDVTGSLSARASGASSLRYAGSPTIERSETSGSSSIQPAG